MLTMPRLFRPKSTTLAGGAQQGTPPYCSPFRGEMYLPVLSHCGSTLSMMILENGEKPLTWWGGKSDRQHVRQFVAV
jgi:hypothetical protein